MQRSEIIEVLFVVPRLGGGGAERVFCTLLTHLDRRRFRPVLAVQDLDGEYMTELPDDVEVLELGPGRFRTRLPRLFGLLWRRRPGVVFTTRGYVNLLVALSRFLLPPGTVHVARQTILPGQALGEDPLSRLKACLYRRHLSRVAKLICQSRDMQEELVNSWEFPANRIAVIHNPVDCDRVRTLASARVSDDPVPPGTIQLLACGRLVPQKGFDVLLDALSRTSDDHHLTILGDGPEREALVRQVGVLGLERRVRILPFKENPFPYMARADAVVLSSRHEGFPNLLLEAGACGTPVIAFHCPGGIDEIVVEGKTGLMVPAGDMEGLAEAMEGGRYRAMDRDRIAASICDRFSVNRIVPRYEHELTSARP